MSSIPQVQSDQFAQSAANGDQDLAITKSGVIVGVLASDVSGPVNAGRRVKLDSRNTVPGKVTFVMAADNEAAFGVIKRTAKQAAFNANDHVEVVASFLQCITLCGGGAINPGVSVGKSGDFVVASDGTHTAMGVALDPLSDSALGRVLIGFVSC